MPMSYDQDRSEEKGVDMDEEKTVNPIVAAVVVLASILLCSVLFWIAWTVVFH